jgi:Rieske 2Fe-2S family protein
MSAPQDDSIVALLESRQPGHGLSRDAYHDKALFALEQRAIWRAHWVFVAHSAELRTSGDFLVVELFEDTILLVRQRDGSLRGLHNVCRHRGSLVATTPCGHLDHLVCPYHGWTYALDGALVSAPGARQDLARAELGLKPVAVHEIGGLVFVALDDHIGADELDQCFGAALAQQGLDRAKVAAQIDYEIAANWKLVWENNRECAHCELNHPQYVPANFDRWPSSASVRAEVLAARVRALEAQGLSGVHHESGLAAFPDPSGMGCCSVSRTALEEGYVSESLDGARVAPLMGSFTSEETGTLRLRAMPNFWCHASCDHAVTTRLIPTSVSSTTARVTWLVDEAAVEGRDYDLERLLPFWRLTSEQDWMICERQQRGVRSPAYQPGPLSTSEEGNVDAFLSWYANVCLRALTTSGP